MARKFKNILSVSLVIIFLTPLTTKLFDGFFHHHHQVVCAVENKQHFHAHHEKCPILKFELSLYSFEKQFFEPQKRSYCLDHTINYFSANCCKNSKYSFLLRAPPISTENSKTS